SSPAYLPCGAYCSTLLPHSRFTNYLPPSSSLFFFNDTATTEIYTLSLHDALPISPASSTPRARRKCSRCSAGSIVNSARRSARRSEEHTSELQSLTNLVCRLLLEKKKIKQQKSKYKNLRENNERNLRKYSTASTRH